MNHPRIDAMRTELELVRKQRDEWLNKALDRVVLQDDALQVAAGRIKELEAEVSRLSAILKGTT